MIHGRVPPGHSSFAAAASVLRGSHREAAMAITRRKLIGAMARLGGAGAAYETLAAWNFLKPPDARAASLALPQDSGAGRTVAILGAGVAGCAPPMSSIVPATIASFSKRRSAWAAAA